MSLVPNPIVVAPCVEVKPLPVISTTASAPAGSEAGLIEIPGVAALLPVTRRFIFLEEGDVAEIRRTSVRIVDRKGNGVDRVACESELSADAAEKGQFRHFMLKEIHEQSRAIAQTLEERVAGGKLLGAAFGPTAEQIFSKVKAVHIAACGTSFDHPFIFQA